MATVYKVTTPSFFSDKEPYMIVHFVKDYKNRFRIGALDSPYYIQVYDLRKIYPEAKNVYDAKKRFVEEVKVGNYEPINLYEFAISDLTDGKHSYIQEGVFCKKESQLRVGVYDNNNERDVAKRMLSFGINHKLFKWD